MKGLFFLLLTLLLETSRGDLWRTGDFDADGRPDTVFFDVSQGVLFRSQASADPAHQDWHAMLALGSESPSQTSLILLDQGLSLTHHSGNRLILAQGQRDGSFALSEFSRCRALRPGPPRRP